MQQIADWLEKLGMSDYAQHSCEVRSSPERKSALQIAEVP
jgi:hypothetical protein